MPSRFQERWMETRSEPFEFDGALVHSIYRRTVEPGAVIEVEFLGSRPSPPQGIDRGTSGYEPEPYEIVQAWWAWSGMRIDESDEGVVLPCSGSYDGPNFDNLTVRVRFVAGSL